MPERTEAYQRQIKDFLKGELKMSNEEVGRLNFSNDQSAFDFAIRQRDHVISDIDRRAEAESNRPMNIRVAQASDRVTAMDWPYGGRVQILDNGTILTDGNSADFLNKLVAMKPLNQSLPDFLRELAKGESGRK